MRRVVVTGLGTVNALAHDLPGTLAAFRDGRCGIGPLTFREAERLSIRIGAEVRDWRPEERFPAKDLPLLDRVTQYALVAGAEAVAMAGLPAAIGPRGGAILGTAAGGIGTWEDSYRAVYAEGRNRVSPLVVPRLMHNAPAAHLSMRHGLGGPVLAVSSACASANHAIGLAFQLIRAGAAEVMLAGGTEAMLCFGGVKAWEGLRVLAPDACRPFSLGRKGLVIGDGAGVLVLEAEDHARARGARILAEVAGFGMTADAADIVAPGGDGAVRAMRAALADAGLAPEEIGYVNAHGTGTLANDRAEAVAIREVFGPAPPPVSSTKAMHGHAIGATGALEAMACIQALTESLLPPTAGVLAADPDCGLDVVVGQARPAQVTAVLSNAFAFGGLNAVLAFRRAD
ncbi:beta-ketoacyl-[acyl-carrier-protein] synthase family protein [Rhodobacter calidifons]|uniref:Beta-ketoacyl-[acyl-carrier-protein] synthase family protein n=1 Tax=Rhodobacter calidifons TaxID=2715277 RepID=A0ABX0G7K6_9RHOB|nr:beta-ketoacyl-[acyl-carrier-protein] synthase family protein [Rhodobacter calidifons]NHB76857.1 beta-ketoacyl-[acyl-carrier-protein] synthase family protein [Rhodobacter calidifons]